MSGAPRPGILEPQGPFLQALILRGGVRFIAWHLMRSFLGEMPTGPETFLELQGVSELRLCARTHPKKALCRSCPISETNDKYRLLPSNRIWEFRTDTSTSCTNTLIIYIHMFCLFNTVVPPTFSSSVSSLWSQTGHNSTKIKQTSVASPPRWLD